MPSVDWLPLCGAVWVLGIRHGLDADHLLLAHGAPGSGLRTRRVDASGYQILLDHFAVRIELLREVGFQARPPEDINDSSQERAEIVHTPPIQVSGAAAT